MTTIDKRSLDITRRDTDYALYSGGKPLTTPGGAELAHHEPRLVESLLRELCLTGNMDTGGLSACSLFCVCADYIPGARETLLESLESLLSCDPIIARHRDSTRKSSVSQELLDSVVDQESLFPFYFSGLTCTVKSLNSFLIEQTQGRVDLKETPVSELAMVFRRFMESMSHEELSAVILLAGAHGAGMVLPLLTVLQRISPSEYANTLFSMQVSDQEPPAWPGVVEQAPIRKQPPDWSDPAPAFTKVRNEVAVLMDCLFLLGRGNTGAKGLQEIIAAGESFNLEFKSTLRWNIKADRKDPAIEHACMKTIAAFLNSSGGTLLVGVRDDGSIEGIETDRFPDHDRFSLHFWNIVKSMLGQDSSPFIHTRIEQCDDRGVLIVQCLLSPRPVFLKTRTEEEFYIRVGPSSARLSISEALTYIANRFGE